MRAFYECECQCDKCWGDNGLEAHHGIENTKVNRKLHGNKVIQSERNCYILCHYCHQNCKYKFKGLRHEEDT